MQAKSKLVLCLFLAFSFSNASAQQANFATSKNNMVASVHPLATSAGVNAFKKGGNAIDAAIATAVTLGVVDGYNSGLGGGCFILIRKAGGELIAIDGREMAPAAAHRNMYIRNGKPDGQASQIGPLAIGVPGAVAAFSEAIEKYGNLPFQDVLEPAAIIAEQGFEISRVFSGRIKSQKKKLAQFPATAKLLLTKDGLELPPGALLIQKDLSNTYRQIAKHGKDWFYKGPFATQAAQWMKTNGGIITETDFANYVTKQRSPIQTSYRGYEIIGFPPPSSGGVHVAQILNILSSFNLKKIYADDPVTFRHIVAEAMKLAFADRAHWLGDPDFANVPKNLIDKKYCQSLAKLINIRQASPVNSYGVPPNSDAEFFERHTTHLTAVDRDGNWVAITSTVNTTFGSKVIIPGLGVVMNNQMDDFSIAPGVPNAYGLIGSENNSIAPGKRPLSSMSPTIVLKDGKPVFTVGAAGGPKIITQVVWAIINHLDLGMPVPKAISEARIHHQWSPDKLMVEKSLPQSLRNGLAELGHEIQISTSVGISQAIGYDAETNLYVGAHDPRIPGSAGGQ